MRNQLKNRTSFNARLNKMNDQTYKMRRQVMDIIYQIKNKGYQIPRIEVRIVNGGDDHIAAYAYLNKNIVHVQDHWLSYSPETLVHVILHEVVHAVTGFKHDENCYLMHPHVPINPEVSRSWDAFKKYMIN